jgi:hypothetical protein
LGTVVLEVAQVAPIDPVCEIAAKASTKVARRAAATRQRASE